MSVVDLVDSSGHSYLLLLLVLEWLVDYLDVIEGHLARLRTVVIDVVVLDIFVVDFVPVEPCKAVAVVVVGIVADKDLDVLVAV